MSLALKNMHSVDALAKKLWDYHHMNHKLEKVGAIFVMGSHDVRVAEYGAELFKQSWAPWIIFSGGVSHVGDLLETSWDKPEAEVFADIARKRGVSEDQIILENKSTNTGENFLYTARMLAEKNLICNSFIVVQKPYMERRTYATGKKLWPDKKLIITSPPLNYEEYMGGSIPKETIINIMVGDIQRIKIYPEKGFQISQEIPPDVWEAYEELVRMGYTKHLVRE